MTRSDARKRLGEQASAAPVDATVVEEWGVRCSQGIYGPVSESEARNDCASDWHHDICVGPRSLVRRTRTTYADHVTEWEEVDE